jgi:ferrous iron transport protein A
MCRLEDMGLRCGKTVEMLSNSGHGSLLVRVDDSRIALGRGVAMKVSVRRIGE